MGLTQKSNSSTPVKNGNTQNRQAKNVILTPALAAASVLNILYFLCKPQVSPCNYKYTFLFPLTQKSSILHQTLCTLLSSQNTLQSLKIYLKCDIYFHLLKSSFEPFINI